MPANKYASAYLNAAYQRMLAEIENLAPPAFDIQPTSEQFSDAAAHLGDLSRAIDAYVHALSVEAASNSTTHISTHDRITVMSDAIDACGLLGDLRDAESELEMEAA